MINRLLLISMILLVTDVAAKEIYVDVGKSAGINFIHHNGAEGNRLLFETMGAGTAFFDYDNDNYLDLYIVSSANTSGNILMRNNGDGTFSDVTDAAGVGNTDFGMGVCVADYDNDGFQDLYITNFGAANVLYQNRGNRRFTNQTQASKTGDESWGTSCAFADIDNDGDLDLYVVNYLNTDQVRRNKCGSATGTQTTYCHPDNFDGEADILYANNGDGTFTDITRLSGIYNNTGKGLGVTFGDYDNDGDADLFVANDSTANFLYRNNGDGSFMEVGVQAGFAYNGHGQAEAGMGIDLADFDNDGLLDVFLTNFDFETNTLYRNFGNGFFGDITAMAGLAADDHPYMGWSTGFVDFDNDGYKDVFITNGHIQDNIQQFTDATHYKQRDQLFRNRGDGRFSSVSNWALVPENTGRGATFGDYDNDGDVDIFIVNNNHTATLLRNDTGNSHHWLMLRTIGTRSNRDGIGARVELVAGNTRIVEEVRSGAGYLSGRDTRLHFGLGSHSYADRLTVKWPSGILQEMKNVPSNQVLVITEPAN